MLKTRHDPKYVSIIMSSSTSPKPTHLSTYQQGCTWHWNRRRRALKHWVCEHCQTSQAHCWAPARSKKHSRRGKASGMQSSYASGHCWDLLFQRGTDRTTDSRDDLCMKDHANFFGKAQKKNRLTMYRAEPRAKLHKRRNVSV